MIGDTFDFNGKQYTLKKELTFGEYKKISKLGNALQKLTAEYESASEDNKIKIMQQFSKTTEDQLEIISNFIETILGLTQSEIDVLSLIDAIELFNEGFTQTTQVKKKSEKTLDLPLS